MIKRLSLTIATGIKSRVPDHPASIAVVAYSLSFIINMFAIICLTLIISIFTNHLLEALVVLTSFAALRQVSGGYHLKSSALCIAVSTAILTALSLVQMSDKNTMYVTLAALVIVAIFSPSRIEKQTRIDPKFFPLLKLISVALVASNLFIESDVLAATFLTQAFTLIMKGGETHNGESKSV